jgi:hypothetical protein
MFSKYGDVCFLSKQGRSLIRWHPRYIRSDAEKKPICYQAFQGRTPGPRGDGTEVYVAVL